MSTIVIRFQTQVLDFSPLTRGVVNVIYNDGNQNFNLPLSLRTGISTSGSFTEVSNQTIDNSDDEQQALNFAQAFNRDYSFFGVTSQTISAANLLASVVGDTVTITAQTGTFPSGSSYSGNVLIVNGFTTVNTTTPTDLNLLVQRTLTGDCNTIQYTAQESGGTSPYTLYNGSNVIQSNWDGTSLPFDLERTAISANIKVVDSDGAELSYTQIIPRNLASGEFEVNQTQFDGSSDLLIESLNPVTGTTPIQYSLDSSSSNTGSSYQLENAFSGVLPGTYKLFIKDVYNCETSKIISISNFQDATTNTVDYFDIMKVNGLIMSPCPTFDKDIKKNFENTLSFNSLDGINYDCKQSFDPSDTIGVQFKSSYPYHIVTLHRCDLPSLDIQPILIQENLGSKEKVDCNLFTIGTQTAVYFDGGNAYQPDSTDIIGASEYTQFLPEWATEGQTVFIDGLGGFTIQGTGFDDDLQKGYFLINVSTTNATGLVQVTYNVQPYNLFEFYISGSQLSNYGRVVVEYGVAFNKILGTKWMSELIVKKEDEEEDLLIEVSSTKNRADVVFQSGISFKSRIKGVFKPFFEGEVTNYDGDSRLYPLTENLYQRYNLYIPIITSRQVYNLSVWCLLDGFRVNNIPLRATNFPEIEQLGDSNLFTLTVELGYTGNVMAIQKDEKVLEVSTGVIGGGRDVNDTIQHDNRTRLTVNGGFVTIGGNFIAI